MAPSGAQDRNPTISTDAFVASSALIAGDVRIGPRCVIDHGAMIIATGSPVEFAAGVVVMPGAVIRSTGGNDRPAYSLKIGEEHAVGRDTSPFFGDLRTRLCVRQG